MFDSALECVFFNDLPFGAITGSVEIIDCVVNHPSIWAEERVYNWVLANPIIFESPIENVKGKLSFWEYPGINEEDCLLVGTKKAIFPDSQFLNTMKTLQIYAVLGNFQ